MLYTDFSKVEKDSFHSKLRVVSEVNAHTANRHLQIANLLAHSSGQILLVCRWDHQAKSEGHKIVWGHGEDLDNSAEGDCTNEQVLFFSQDGGESWQIANDGKSILTLELGTSFALPSSITHAFLDENKQGVTRLYYTIDQPMTCGAAHPWLATGCGEIRRIGLCWDGRTWRTNGQSEIVQPIFAPMPVKGSVSHTIRTACLNPILRLADGTALMPISGRDTLPEPDGCYWKENRCWVLRSEDDGDTWTPYFIGGGNEVCLCECTLAQLSDGNVYALMRAGYGTGKSLYYSLSLDGGRTFSDPAPTGLPNTSSGVKPFLLRLQSGRYLLLQTDEHNRPHRLNIMAFVTDEEGLLRNRWKYKRVLCCDCREKWQGSAYPTALQTRDGKIHIAFAGFTAQENRMYHLGVEESWLCGAIYEPSGGMLNGHDAVPVCKAEGMYFINTRARAQAGQFGAFSGRRFVRLQACVKKYPQTKAFALAGLYSMSGSQKEIAIEICGEGVFLDCCEGRILLSEPVEEIEAVIAVRGENRYKVIVNDCSIECFGHSFGDPDTLLSCGQYDEGEEMDVRVKKFGYGVQ